MKEAPILRETLLALSALKLPDGRRACIVWRQQVGTFRWLHAEGVINVGTEGMADIGGVLADGRALQVEVKSTTGQLRPAQHSWREAMQRMGAVHLVVRDSETAVSRVLEALDAC